MGRKASNRVCDQGRKLHMRICIECGYVGNTSVDVRCNQCGVELTNISDLESGDIQIIGAPRLAVGAILANRYRILEIIQLPHRAVYYHAQLIDSPSATLCWITEVQVQQPHPLSTFDLSASIQVQFSERNPLGITALFLKNTTMAGLPKFLDCFEDDRWAYLVVEKPDAKPLSFIGQVTEGEAHRIGGQVCRILTLIHRVGLIHNGIEPNSLWLDGQGQVWLMCFDRMRPRGLFDPIFPLTPIDGYSPPEYIWLTANVQLDARIDVYSTGCVLYFLLTGHSFSSRPSSLHLRRGLGTYPELLLSPAFERILLRTLALNPQHRFTSVVELAATLVSLAYLAQPQAGSYTDVGRHRELNEDSILILDLQQYFESSLAHVGLYVVSDGMGGEAAGEVASRITVRAIAEWITERLITMNLRSTHGSRLMQSTESGDILYISETGTNARSKQLLTSAILHANREILDYAGFNPASEGMGATVTAALLIGNMLTVGQVGDSRCYVLSHGRLELITEDHSLVERMVRRGELTSDEARHHPHRNIIYRSVGSTDEIEVDIVTRRLQANDTVLLCSDGLTNMLDDELIAEILGRCVDPWSTSKELVIAANACGGEDNISAVVIRIL